MLLNEFDDAEAPRPSVGTEQRGAGGSGQSEVALRRGGEANAVPFDIESQGSDAPRVEEPVAGSSLGSLRFAIGEPGQAAWKVVSRVPADPGLPVDTIAAGGRAGSLEVRAASVCGLLHRDSGRPRQDDFAFCAIEDWLVVAVADGVSAGPLSHRAATLACRTGAGGLRDALTTAPWAEVDWHGVFVNCCKRIISDGRRILASEGQLAPAEAVGEVMATTLLLAAIRTEPDDDNLYRGGLVAHGDTSAFIVAGGRWTPLTPVKNEGALIASSATAALPYLPKPVKATNLSLAPGEALFLMTDGVGDPLGSGTGEVGECLAELWAAPPDPLLFAAHTGFARWTYDDDRTVVGVWPQRD